jgi:hypothetical protein
MFTYPGYHILGKSEQCVQLLATIIQSVPWQNTAPDPKSPITRCTCTVCTAFYAYFPNTDQNFFRSMKNPSLSALVPSDLPFTIKTPLNQDIYVHKPRTPKHPRHISTHASSFTAESKSFNRILTTLPKKPHKSNKDGIHRYLPKIFQKKELFKILVSCPTIQNEMIHVSGLLARAEFLSFPLLSFSFCCLLLISRNAVPQW